MSNETGARDLEQRLTSSLHAAAPQPPADLADRLLRRTAAEPRRRAWGGRIFVQALAAAAVVAIAVVAGLQLGNLMPQDEIGGVPSPSATAPSVSPSPSASATAEPTSTPTPSPSPSPDEVFPGGSTCQNDTLGYGVGYPEDWYANEEVPSEEGSTRIPPCQYFAEEPFELQPNTAVPPTVAIGFQVQPQAPPPGGTIISEEAVTVDGRAATVRETENTDGGGFGSAGQRFYEYLVSLPDGSTLIASTDSDRDGDYDAHKEVLDRMMETLDLIEG